MSRCVGVVLAMAIGLTSLAACARPHAISSTTIDDLLTTGWSSSAASVNAILESESSANSYYLDGEPAFFQALLQGGINPSALETVSQTTIFLDGQSVTTINATAYDQFGHYNPQFLSWFLSSLKRVVANKQVVAATQTYYTNHYQESVRAYLSAYKTLNAYNKKSALIGNYEELVSLGHSDQFILPEALIPNEKTLKTTQPATLNLKKRILMFWIRRSADGTDAQFFGILSTMKTAFDPSL